MMNNLIISGRVIVGKHKGSELGFPTLNIAIPNSVNLEDYGVYLVSIDINEMHYIGMANLGTRPTFNDETPLLEVHVFDYNENILGVFVEVTLLKKIREIMKFETEDELKRQLKIDYNECLKTRI